jgi:hypothetical protein
VCHRFRLTKRDDYFWVDFELSIIFGGSWSSIENWLEPKTEPPLGNLACTNPRNTVVMPGKKVKYVEGLESVTKKLSISVDPFQISLWEEERNRFKFTDGVLYNQFLSHADYDVVRNYAENLGYLVWSSDRNRTIIVTKEGHDPVRKFWKHQSRS